MPGVFLFFRAVLKILTLVGTQFNSFLRYTTAHIVTLSSFCSPIFNEPPRFSQLFFVPVRLVSFPFFSRAGSPFF